MSPDEAAARFASLVSRPEVQVPLDEAALLVCAHARPALALGPYLDALDELAAKVPGTTIEDVLDHLFARAGFRGNAEDYYDPRNSYLVEVLDRRLGIPITLAVVVMEVGRRLGLRVDGLNTPGHFLLRAGPAVVDPFTGQVVAGTAAEELAGIEAAGKHAILARILANLKAGFTAAEEVQNLLWVLRLRSALPTVPDRDRIELAETLSVVGRFDRAADVYDSLARARDGEQADRLAERASRLRARLN
jgi:regulator of sirC expression with transglutaminase-like and TPR domain